MFTSLKNAIRGKKKLQTFFEKVHQYSLSGMNIGTGTEFTTAASSDLRKLVRFP